MSKMQYHFHPKNLHIHYILLRKYTQLPSRQNKTLSDNLHSAACKQTNARIKTQTLAVSSPSIYSVLGVIAEVVSELTVQRSDLTNRYLTPLSARMYPKYYSNMPTVTGD